MTINKPHTSSDDETTENHGITENHHHRHHRNRKSALVAKLEGSAEGQRPKSHEEATLYSAFTTSGASTGTRRRTRQSGSSSFSGEILSGSHIEEDHPKPKGTRRRRNKSVAETLDLAAPHDSEGHRHGQRHRRVLKREGRSLSGGNLTRDENQMSMSRSVAETIASAPTADHKIAPSDKLPSSPQSHRRSKSGAIRSGGGSSPQKNPSDESRGMPMKRNHSTGRLQESPTSGGPRSLPRRSLSPSQKLGESRPVRRRSRDKYPHARQHYESFSSLKRPGTNQTNFHQSRLHDSVNTISVMTSWERRRQRSKSPHGLGSAASTLDRNPKARSLSPVMKEDRRVTALETLLGKNGRPHKENIKGSKIPTRKYTNVIKGEEHLRIKSDTSRQHTNGINHRHIKKSEKPKVRQNSHDNKIDKNKKKTHQPMTRAPLPKPAQTRKVLDSEVKILSLNNEQKLFDASMSSLLSEAEEEDWGDTEFSEAFEAPTSQPPNIQQIPFKSHRMKVEEDLAHFPRRAKASSNRLNSSNDANATGHHRHESAPHLLEALDL